MPITTPIDTLVRQERVLETLREELVYQRGRAAEWQNANASTVGEELLLMEDYLARARAVYTNSPGDTEALHMLCKVAGMGVRAMINHGVVERIGGGEDAP